MIYNQKFALNFIAKTFGQDHNRLNQHIQRGLLKNADNPSQDDEPYSYRRFSITTAMHFGLAYSLIDDFGMKIPKAFSSVMDFVYTGHRDHGFLPDRLPALPYHPKHGDTIITIDSGGSCHTIPTDTLIASDYPDYLPDYKNIRRSLKSDTFIVLNASQVFNKICARLDHNPSADLGEIYDNMDAHNKAAKEAAEKQAAALRSGEIKP